MRKWQATLLLAAALAVLIVLLVCTSFYAIRFGSGAEPTDTGATEPEAPTETEGAAHRGLVTENGCIYYYNADGTLFTEGYLEVKNGETVDYYYFLPNGQAFTSGYKAVELDGVTCYFCFEADGTAFTGGRKDLTFGDESYTYYFQSNGRAFTSGAGASQEDHLYYQPNGRAAKDAFVTVDGRLCYFDESGKLVTGGWFCLESTQGYYYADSTGALATDTVIEGYKLDATGKSSTKYRIVQYVTAHTDPAMSDQEKIRALYQWILNSDMTYIRAYEHTKADWTWYDGWVDDMAADHMNRWGGNCYRYAAFLGMLIREATGLPVRVFQGKTLMENGSLTAHGWTGVCQDGVWYIYDVQLQKFNSFFKESYCYMVPPEEARMHLRGVGTDLY